MFLLQYQLLMVIITIVITIICYNSTESYNFGNPQSSQTLEKWYKNGMATVQGELDVILFYGTLLGYYREGNFINKDNDIDVLAYSPDVKTFLNNHKNDSNINGRNPMLGKVKLGFEIYAYEFDKEGNVIVIWEINKSPNQFKYKKSDIFPLKKVNFKGYDVYVPNNIPNVLEQSYGKNYMIPNKK